MRTTSWIFAICTLAFASASGTAQTAATSATATADGAAGRAAATITGADVLQRLSIIAHDSMRGRDTPSRGLEMTAAYVAGQFRSFKLNPAGDSGSFIQRYPYASRHIDNTIHMLESVGGRTALTFGSDFFVVPAEVDSVVGTPYFLGTMDGAPVPPNLRGRILVAAVPDTFGPSWQARVGELLPAAMGAGAGALILILDPKFTTRTIAALAAPLSEQVAPFPVFGVRADAIAPLLAGTGLAIATVFAATPVPARELTGLSLRLRTPFSESNAQVPNVVAILPGSDPVLRDEYVVFSAHMDHVGVGSANAKGDSIFNGADDDGSGTTAIMEIAQAFAALPAPPRRSLIFLTVSGEEKGLLGSSWFVEHPPVPAARIVADINIDMIGRNNPDSVTAIGLEYSTLGPSASQVSKAYPELHLIVAPDLTPEEQLFLRSDHFNFARKDIPAIFFTTGLHKDYHEASDEVASINIEKLARVARLAFLLGYTVANDTVKPSWTQLGRDVVRAARASMGGQ
jgi:Zn-dependent M28 family amino/carboxypeptidase